MHLHCVYWYKAEMTHRFDTGFQNFSLLQTKSRIQDPCMPFPGPIPVLNVLSCPFTSLTLEFLFFLTHPLCLSLPHPPLSYFIFSTHSWINSCCPTQLSFTIPQIILNPSCLLETTLSCPTLLFLGSFSEVLLAVYSFTSTACTPCFTANLLWIFSSVGVKLLLKLHLLSVLKKQCKASRMPTNLLLLFSCGKSSTCYWVRMKTKTFWQYTQIPMM